MSHSPQARHGLLLACGIWLVGLGVYFIFLRPALLPEDTRFMGTSLEAFRSAAPGLSGGWPWYSMSWGFMVGAGVLLVFVARTAVPLRHRGTGVTLALAGLLTVALMSATNFVLHWDFRCCSCPL